MNCEICNQDRNPMAVIPKRKENGAFSTFACIPCSVEQGMYCEKHEISHLGFSDGTTACRECIEEEVRDESEEIAKSFKLGLEKSPQKSQIMEEMDDYIVVTGVLTGNSKDQCVARAVVTASKRLKKTPEEIINETCEKGPEILFPRPTLA